MDPSTFQAHTSLQPSVESTQKPLINQFPKEGSSKNAVISAHQEQHLIRQTKNLYPIVRHIILVVCVLFFIVLIIFLVLQNGKNIYDNGI